MRRPSLFIIVPKSCQTCHEVLLRPESDIYRTFRPSSPICTRNKPSRKRDTYDSKMTHLPHGTGSQRPHNDLGNGDTMGTSNPTRTRHEGGCRQKYAPQCVCFQRFAECRAGSSTRHSKSGQPGRYGTFIGHMRHRTRHEPGKPVTEQDINRTLERASNGHKGQRDGSQTAQTAHSNGPDMGQRGHNRAIIAPNAPFSDGIAQYPQPIRNRPRGYPQREVCHG